MPNDLRSSSPFSLRATRAIPDRYGPLPRILRAGRVLERGGVRLLERAMGLAELDRLHATIPSDVGPAEYARRALEVLGIDVEVPDRDLARVPRTGPLVIVANHPFGMLDGIALTSILHSLRGDVRVLANGLLCRLDALRPSLIGVDPFGGPGSKARNHAPLREAIRWVRGGGALCVFPAGEVAHRRLPRMRVVEPAWSETIARIITKGGATTVPMYFEGTNSLGFHALGLLHPRLRTAMLPRELLRRRGESVRVRVGHPIPSGSLAGFGSDRERIDYLRLRTEILQRRLPTSAPRGDRALAPLARAEDPAQVRSELLALPPESCLAEQGDLVVYVADAEQIPYTMREIGRRREEAFRLVGEGTGRASDVDRFDRTYHQLILWDRSVEQIAGGYRIGVVNELLARGGKSALYTSTLFHLDPRFIEYVRDGLELGRSFVAPPWQRSSAALQVLWKGIAAFTQRDPRRRKLFGPVSMSGDYHPLSLRLIVDHLERHRRDPAADWVRARTPDRRLKTPAPSLTAGMVDDLADVSRMVFELEDGERGVPVLLRQYVRLGGRFLGFNRDRSFGDALDGLVLVDLDCADRRLLARFFDLAVPNAGAALVG